MLPGVAGSERSLGMRSTEWEFWAELDDDDAVGFTIEDTFLISMLLYNVWPSE